jgi:hypothetical protein
LGKWINFSKEYKLVPIKKGLNKWKMDGNLEIDRWR